MKSLKTILFVLLTIGFCTWWSSCKEDELAITNSPIETPAEPAKMKGTADLLFSDYAPLKNNPIRLYYHVPANATTLTPILLVFHGTDRNAQYCRDEMIANANKLGFIIIAPEFSVQYYPTADSYNLGNIFVDGDNPSPSTLNQETAWTFSAIEPIFNFMKAGIGSSLNSYDVFGHSAGGQFVHRYLLYKPLAKINRLVTASSGWYTMFDNSISFPYGTKHSPVELSNYNNLFNKKVFVIVGDLDIDPNSSDLRHNEIVDKQGLNRFTRAQHFYTQSRAAAIQSNSAFNWKYYSLKGIGHDFSGTSAAAANYLYQ
jgi:hypothetical protein